MTPTKQSTERGLINRTGGGFSVNSTMYLDQRKGSHSGARMRPGTAFSYTKVPNSGTSKSRQTLLRPMKS